MKNKKEKDKEWMVEIDENGELSGDIEAIRIIYHQNYQKEAGLIFDSAPYCG
jgi:hypothetical protein